MKEWTTPDFRNTPSTTNLREEEIVDASGNNGNTSMPEQAKRPKPWKKKKKKKKKKKMMMMMMMMMMIIIIIIYHMLSVHHMCSNENERCIVLQRANIVGWGRGNSFTFCHIFLFVWKMSRRTLFENNSKG